MIRRNFKGNSALSKKIKARMKKKSEIAWEKKIAERIKKMNETKRLEKNKEKAINKAQFLSTLSNGHEGDIKKVKRVDW